MEKRFLKPEEAAYYLSISPVTFRRLVTMGVLPKPVLIDSSRSKLPRYDRVALDDALLSGARSAMPAVDADDATDRAIREAKEGRQASGANARRRNREGLRIQHAKVS